MLYEHLNYECCHFILNEFLIISSWTRLIYDKLHTCFLTKPLTLLSIFTYIFTFALAVGGSGDVRRQLTLLFLQARAQKHRRRRRKIQPLQSFTLAAALSQKNAVSRLLFRLLRHRRCPALVWDSTLTQYAFRKDLQTKTELWYVFLLFVWGKQGRRPAVARLVRSCTPNTQI